MNRLLSTLVLLLCSQASAAAQGGIRITPYVGSFEPMFPMVSVADGLNPDVELSSAPLVGVEVAGALARFPWLHAYTGIAHTAPRLHLSGAMESAPANGPSVRSRILVPTAGIVLSPRLGNLPFRPTLRLGGGVKSYTFDLAEQRSRVANFTGDVGFGAAAAWPGGPGLSAEARWLPSRFNARNLPIRSDGGERQEQNDWVFQIGLRLTP